MPPALLGPQPRLPHREGRAWAMLGVGTIIEYYLALALHVLRLPGERSGRIFSSLGYRLDRRNRWSTSTTELHTLAFRPPLRDDRRRPGHRRGDRERRGRCAPQRRDHHDLSGTGASPTRPPHSRRLPAAPGGSRPGGQNRFNRR